MARPPESPPPRSGSAPPSGTQAADATQPASAPSDATPPNPPRNTPPGVTPARFAAVLIPALLLLATAFAPDQSRRYRVDEWSVSLLSLAHLALCLILGAALAWLIAGWLPRRMSAARRMAAALPTALLAGWLALSLLPHPVTLGRAVLMGDAAGGLDPIQAREAWRLNAPWELTGPRGDPQPAGEDVVFHLFRLTPGSGSGRAADPAPASDPRVMSCPDRQAGRGWLASVDRRITLDRWDLPVDAHVPYLLLADFCAPGVRLSGKAADPALPDDVRARLIRLAGPRTTGFSEYELASAIGRPDLARPGPGGVNARGRYLQYLHANGRIAATPTDGMDLASHQDLLLAATQCDVDYARFLLARGVLGAGPTLLYLARELDGAYERDASLRRDPAFPLGLASPDAPACLALARLLAGHAPESVRTAPVVQRVLKRE